MNVFDNCAIDFLDCNIYFAGKKLSDGHYPLFFTNSFRLLFPVETKTLHIVLKVKL